MTVAAFLLAALVVARVLARWRAPWLLAIGIAAIPIGVAVATCSGPAGSRTRVSVSFVGYRVPLPRVADCAAPVRIDQNRGIWIGGGARRDEDPAPDVVAIPGFRPHLLQICSAGAPLAAQKYSIRAVEPGIDRVWNGARSTAEPPSGAHTQRLSLKGIGGAITPQAWTSDRCLKVGSARIPIADIESFVTANWKLDDRSVPRGRRGRLITAKRQLFGPAVTGDVFCVDLGSGKPQRCSARVADPRKALFVWREDGGLLDHWTGLPPVSAWLCDCGNGAAVAGNAEIVDIAAVDLAADAVLSEKQLRVLPGISVRMISRRFNPTVADVTVGHAGNRFSPAPHRLGNVRQLRFARSESDLLIFVEEPTVQIRLDDLFGNAAVDALPQGEFDVVFGNLRGGGPLIVDLSADAEEFLPKPLLWDWVSRVSMTEGVLGYLERSSGAIPRRHHFGEIATFGSESEVVRPLILVDAVTPPKATWVLPLIAAVLLVIPLLDAARRQRPVDAEWDLAAIAFALLTFRWMLATRAWMDDPQTPGRRLDWSLCGVLLLLTPCLLIVAQPLFQRLWQRTSGSVVKARPAWPVVSVCAILDGIAAMVWIVFSSATLADASGVARYALLATGSSALAGVLALELYRLLRRFTRARAVVAARPAPVVPAPAAPAVAAPSVPTNRWSARTVRRQARPSSWKPKLRDAWAGAGGVLRPGLLRESWLLVAVLAGALLVALRFVGMVLGAQEEIFSVRIDVFFLPAVAVGFALLSRDSQRAETERLLAMLVFAAMILLGVGFLVNDLGLLWVGGMAMVLALPFVSSRPMTAATLALLILAFGFLSPKFARAPFLYALRNFGETTVLGADATLSFDDELQAQRERDYYRMLDTVQSDLVEAIPSQLAREVVVDRERVRYQATSGAWRTGFRERDVAGNDMLGAGYLRSKPIIGQRSFREAARSDYVYPLYVRSEFGWMGLLALTALYVVSFLVSVRHGNAKRRSARVAVWALAIAAGTGLFMIGGTSSLFPFSGKWPLFLAFASKSDFALGLALLFLGLPEDES